MGLVVRAAEEVEDEVRANLRDNLHWIRSKRGLTQAELAMRSSVSAKAVADAETGRRQPYPSNLGLMAKVLEIPVSDLLLDHKEFKLRHREVGALDPFQGVMYRSSARSPSLSSLRAGASIRTKRSWLCRAA